MFFLLIQIETIKEHGQTRGLQCKIGAENDVILGQIIGITTYPNAVFDNFDPLFAQKPSDVNVKIEFFCICFSNE